MQKGKYYNSLGMLKNERRASNIKVNGMDVLRSARLRERPQMRWECVKRASQVREISVKQERMVEKGWMKGSQGCNASLTDSAEGPSI